MLRNKITFAVLTIAAAVVTACSSPTAPEPRPLCGVVTGGEICK